MPRPAQMIYHTCIGAAGGPTAPHFGLFFKQRFLVIEKSQFFGPLAPPRGTRWHKLIFST